MSTLVLDRLGIRTTSRERRRIKKPRDPWWYVNTVCLLSWFYGFISAVLDIFSGINANKNAVYATVAVRFISYYWHPVRNPESDQLQRSRTFPWIWLIAMFSISFAPI